MTPQDTSSNVNKVVLKKYASQADFDNDTPFEIAHIDSDLFPISEILAQGAKNVT